MKAEMKVYHSFETTEWSGGTTTQFYIYPEDSHYKDRDFIFRLSSAVVRDEESVFTKLDGFKRILLMLDGKVSLSYNGEKEIELSPGMQDTFDGGWDTVSHGSAVDFNLMMSERAKGRVTLIYLLKKEKENLVVYPEDGFDIFTILYVLRGKLKIRGDENNTVYQKNEVIVFRGGDEVSAYELENAGEEKVEVVKTCVWVNA